MNSLAAKQSRQTKGKQPEVKQTKTQKPLSMAFSNDWLQRFLRSVMLVCWVGLFWLGGLVTAAPATASILWTAASDTVVVQSRRTLRDQHAQSWQVIAFKQLQQNIDSDAVYLRLIGFPGRAEIAHSKPIVLTDWQDQTWMLNDCSDQIAAMLEFQPNAGQYDFQLVSQLPTQLPLQLALPMVNHPPVVLRIPAVLIREWQTVAEAKASQVINHCELFPLEARQNPNFPQWTGCQIHASQLENQRDN